MTHLTDLERACFGAAAWTHAQVTGALEAPGAVVVVEEGVGYVLGVRVLDEVELHRIGVLPTRRREGHGRRLYDRFVEAATSAGARQLFLEVREDNHAARALYASVGLETVGTRPRYYADGCAAVVMAGAVHGAPS